MFTPDVLDPAVAFLAELADDGQRWNSRSARDESPYRSSNAASQ
jgi:hypothetical protein